MNGVIIKLVVSTKDVLHVCFVSLVVNIHPGILDQKLNFGKITQITRDNTIENRTENL